MQFSARSGPFVVGCLVVSALSASNAAAYCQTTTSDKQASSCSSTCITEGFPLAWPDSDITYYFNARGFPGLSDTELRGIFDDAFSAWTAVDCEGTPVGLKVEAAQRTTNLTVGPIEEEPNESVIAHIDLSEWVRLGLDPRAFALTAIWYDANSGRILGADMHFNGDMDPFGVCPDSGCDPNFPLTDLPNVATHEAGHFLGLAHSQDQDSTMWCDAQGSETNKRTLAIDDARGLCAVYPTGVAFTDDYFPNPPPSRRNKSSGGCAVAPGSGSAGAGVFSLLLGIVWFGRRRKR